MVTIRWTKDRGWHDAQVRAREPISLDPAAAVLHYGQEIFEGLKAYTLSEGSIALFRPEQNARRFRASAVRMALPELPEALFMQAIEELVKIDRAWIPGGEGSLYLRPFMIATEGFLGVRPSQECLFMLIASSRLFQGRAKASRLAQRPTRARPKAAPARPNARHYAASLLAQAEAIEQGCDQVVFLDAAEHRWLRNSAAELLLRLRRGSMMTPPLSGTILPAITRDSIITSPARGARSARSATASSNGAPTRQAASCARFSLAVRPRSSRRSARSRVRTAISLSATAPAARSPPR